MRRAKSSLSYAIDRVRGLTKPIGPRLESCGSKFVPIACACDPNRLAEVKCRQWWFCMTCQRARAARYEMKLRASLREAEARAVRAWNHRGSRGMQPSLVLLTLTQRHSGSLAADVAALRDGWRRLYKSMHPTFGRFEYVAVWEVTPGRCSSCDGYVDDRPTAHVARARRHAVRFTAAEHRARNPCACSDPRPEGHVHLHVAAVWGYRDYGRVRELWLAACPTSEMFSVVRKRIDGKASTPTSIAHYLGAYLSKGVDASSFTAELRAEVSAAFYNAHLVFASIGFWEPENHDCKKCHAPIRRKRAIEADVYDAIVREQRVPHYHLVRQEPLADRVGEITLHVWHHALEPPSDPRSWDG
jgi:hypothetical protein